MSRMISTNDTEILRKDDGYGSLLSGIRRSFDEQVNDGQEPLFTTNVTGLYDLILDALPAEARQHYNCRTCRHFVDHYGGLVRIDDNGDIHPVMWDFDVPAFFAKAVSEVQDEVESAKVTGVFVTGDRRLGTPKTGEWTHMAVELPKNMVHIGLTRSAYQTAAEKTENYWLLANAVGKYKKGTVNTALKLLRSNSLYRGEKVLGVAEWFKKVLDEITGKRSRQRTNILWKKAATAPAGFCHVSSSMIGTLLDDIEAGYDYETVSQRFSSKMNPIKYQRPQAAPDVGNVMRAEKIVAKLGIENSLRRRFARLDEIQTIWKPKAERKSATTSGVFSGVETKRSSAKREARDISAPRVTMTWAKFCATVLPEAKKIQYLATDKKDHYGAIVTASDISAPPIIRWDSEEKRCPFNWYVYSGGSYPGTWGLSQGWVDVTGIALQPNLWQPGFESNGRGVFFILKDCKDRRYENSGNALFPETLRGELHEVRATIEAYSRKATLEGFGGASACGLRCCESSKWWDYTFRVTTDLGTTVYVLDRWD